MIGAPWTIGQTVTRTHAGAVIPPPSAGVLGTTGPFVWDAASARRVPAVARAIQLYAGMVKQMPIDAYRGPVPLPRPRLLARPDPTRARSWYVQVSVEDYLLNGNAVSYVTSRGYDGWPTTVAWLPASWVFLQWDATRPNSEPDYYLRGSKLDPANVIHVRRGADRTMPVRGVGIVEEFLSTLDRVAMEEAYESSALAGGAVPSVAIITPQATLTQDVADDAKAQWLSKFGGPTREPVILPNGTVVTPLSWSPTDTQLIEARKMSLLDVANIFNLDGYWLGSPVAGMTYKTAGPQYLQILRTSLEPLLADFEDVWSDAWMPRGNFLRFDRNQLLRDDLPTTTQAMVALVGAGIITTAEARQYLALPVVAGDTSEPMALQPPAESIGTLDEGNPE